MDFKAYIKFYFHGGFDDGLAQYEATGGKGPYNRKEALIALGAPTTFQGDPKAEPDPYFWVPPTQRKIADLATSDLKRLQSDAKPLCPPFHLLPELPP